MYAASSYRRSAIAAGSVCLLSGYCRCVSIVLCISLRDATSRRFSSEATRDYWWGASMAMFLLPLFCTLGCRVYKNTEHVVRARYISHSKDLLHSYGGHLANSLKVGGNLV